MKKIVVFLFALLILISGCISEKKENIENKTDENIVKLNILIKAHQDSSKSIKRVIGFINEGIYIPLTDIKYSYEYYSYDKILTMVNNNQTQTIIDKIKINPDKTYIILDYYGYKALYWSDFNKLIDFNGAYAKNGQTLTDLKIDTKVKDMNDEIIKYADGSTITENSTSTPSSISSLRVYFIGNSVTDSINYDGLAQMALSRNKTHTWARYMIPGAPLSWIWTHQTGGFTAFDFGNPEYAFTNFTWDAISLQPFDRNILDTTEGDLVMVQNFVNLTKTKSPNLQVYIYQRWPRKPQDFKNTADEWNTLWLSSYDINNPGWSNVGQEARTYSEQLTNEIRKVYPNMKPFLIVPVGEVFYELNKKMAAGQIAGYKSIWDVYSDGIHMSETGSFIVGATYYATMYKEDPRGIAIPGVYGTIASDVKNQILQTIWDVVRNYKDSNGKPWSGVVEGTRVLVTGIELNLNKVELNISEKVNLIPNIIPTNATDKTIKWSTSNSQICTVDTLGVVTAVGAGDAIITAATNDGNKTSTCAITVKSMGIAVTGVAITPTSISLIKGATTQLTALIAPTNATNKNCIWSSSATTVATVNDLGVVTALGKGVSEITVTSVSGGYQAVCTVNVTIPNTAPIAVISASAISGTVPLTIKFDASMSSDSDAGDFVLGYDWDFGTANASASSVNPEYTFTTPGAYVVKLRVMDSNNLRGEWISVTINATSASQEIKKRIAINHTNFSPDSLSEEEISKAKMLDVYFEHASVGSNIVAGISELGKTIIRYGGYTKLSINNNTVDRKTVDPLWFDSNNGLADLLRAYPPGYTMNGTDKLNMFVANVNAGIGEKADIAMFKLCYLDAPKDPLTYFTSVKNEMEKLEAKYQSVDFVWFTMPHQNWGNQNINAYNELVRAYCSANNKWLFDISDIETHNDQGVLSTSNNVPIIVAEYTDDGGHLNLTGRAKAAKAYWKLIGEIAKQR